MNTLREPTKYVPKLRDARLETEIAQKLRRLPLARRIEFIEELANLHETAALGLARRVLNGRSLAEFTTKRLIASDSSSIKGWLEFARDKLGARRLFWLLNSLCESNPRTVLHALYWLPSILHEAEWEPQISELRKNLKLSAPRHGEPYSDQEIEEMVEIYLSTPNPRRREVKETLAARFGRTVSAIDFVFRWIEQAQFKKEARGRIYRQVNRALKKLSHEK